MNEGEIYTLKIIPDEGMKVSSIKDNGVYVSISSTYEYKIISVNESHKIVVAFDTIK